MNGNRELFFVDTNIIVYAHDLSAGAKHDRARELMQTLWDTGIGCISIQVLQEFFVAVTRKVARPIKTVDAARVIKDLATWNLHQPNANDVLGAIELQRYHQASFWDAMILWSASQMGCSKLYSEDLSSDQIYESVLVVNPFLDKS
ncbi:MAG: PIN domain-containing protein [Anaerolineales bacterium]|nr:PIN domain-containing protein [Anaerolineales bacterium]